jgi:hypothetical protein
VIEDQFLNRINDAAGERLLKTEIDALVNDCYDLIIEYIRAEDARRYNVGMQPHIYAVPPSQFQMFSKSLRIDSAAIATSHAVLIR